MAKIYTSVISRHQGHWAMFSAFQTAAAVASHAGHIPMLAPHVGDSLCCRARQNALAHFLKSDADYLFTLDDDVAIPENALVDLINADKDIIGGFYRLKKNPPAGEEFSIADYIAFRGLVPFNLNDNEPVRVKYISNGCIMHKRKFIEDMVNHYPELLYKENETGNDRWALYQPYVYNNEYLSEDWAFCQRAIDKGYEMWMHTGVLCDHWGLQKFGFHELLNG